MECIDRLSLRYHLTFNFILLFYGELANFRPLLPATRRSSFETFTQLNHSVPCCCRGVVILAISLWLLWPARNRTLGYALERLYNALVCMGALTSDFILSSVESLWLTRFSYRFNLGMCICGKTPNTLPNSSYFPVVQATERSFEAAISCMVPFLGPFNPQLFHWKIFSPELWAPGCQRV